MAGMFGNRFDTMSVLDDALYKEGLGVGQLSSYGVGQMAAYTEGLMGNPFAAAVNDLASPEMQKQKILDELQRKHPNPDTPEELQALANDLAMNGFGDMAQKVRTEATNLIAANSATIKANQPTADLYKGLTSALQTQVLTKPFINKYLTDIGRTDLVQPYKKNTNGFSTYESYKGEKDAYIKDLENLFTQWGNSYKYNGSTKNDIATLISDDAAMTNSFLQYISKHGNADLAKQIQKSMMGANVENTSETIGVQIRNERTGDTEDVDMTRPEVKKMSEEIENMASVKAIENDIVQLERFIANSVGNASELVRIKLELLKKRRDFLTSQSASLEVPVDATGVQQSVETTWFA